MDINNVENTDITVEASENVAPDVTSEQPVRRPLVYIKNTDAIGHREGKRHYHQCFLKPNFATMAKTPVMAMVHDGIVDPEDMKILEYIYTARFSTIEQITRFCNSEDIENATSRVELLMSSGLLNAFFMVGSGKAGQYVRKPDDARLFYCLTQGSKYILDEYTDRLFIEWEAGDNIANIKNIESQVVLNEIYLDMKTSKAKMISNEPKPSFNLKEEILRCSAYYGFKDSNDATEYIIFDTIRREDNIDNIRKKIRMWETLLCTQIWRRYFNDTKKIPMLVFLTDNDELAYTLSQNIATGSKLSIFLITTFDRTFNKELGATGRFIKHKREEDKLYEISYKLFG